MKIFSPSYYKQFKCIADRCRHSCCIGWEIGIDDDTINKYSLLPECERKEVLSYIDDEGCVILEGGERCPFLCDDGLCRLISTYGEGYISQICREHPRFYHRVGERVECGIGASCEEACRLILSSDFVEFYALDVADPECADESDYDTISHRELIYSILCDVGISYREKLDKIKKIYSVDDSILKSESLRNALSELEYLDDSHREIISVEVGDGCQATEDIRIYLERFFAYLVFRHLSVAEHYDNLRARLGFCLLLLSIFERAVKGRDKFDEVCDTARIISEEIEYSEDNTAALIFEIECLI